MFTTNERFNLSTLIAGGELTANMTRMQCRIRLVELGWEYLNGGSYSSAWLSPDETKVVKIAKHDAGAEAICEAHARDPFNRALPVYYGRIALKAGGFVYEVERLGRMGPYGDEGDMFTNAKALAQAASFGDEWVSVDNALNGTHIGNQLRQAGVILETLIAEYGEHNKGKIAWDLHRANMMQRGGEPVLIDPIYDPPSYDTALSGSVVDECNVTGEPLTPDMELAA